MLEKVSHVAEQAATNVSRRQFLGRIGHRAAVTAAALGGLLALPGVVRGGKKDPRLCSAESGVCALVYEGSPCGTRGVCKAADPKDKSDRPLCTCHQRGRKKQ